MSELLIASIVVVAAVTTLALVRHHRQRTRLYADLARRRTELLDQHAPELATDFDTDTKKTFAREHIVRIEHTLTPRSLTRLQAECLANREHAERSFIPKHKKGGTLSYEAMHHLAPACLALYHSMPLRESLSRLVGLPLQPTADHDQSSCSLLYYDQAGDHIGWHYDYNFYRGRHFTVLISLVNRSSQGELSKGRLQRKTGSEISDLATGENTLVIFEGAKVFHRATAIDSGEQRVMLSMTFCTEPRISPLKELMRRIKDTAYYGPRVLFD